MKLMKNTFLSVSKMIAIGDRKATIAIAIGDIKATIVMATSDLFSIGDWDRDWDPKFDQDRNHNFRDRGHALVKLMKWKLYL